MKIFLDEIVFLAENLADEAEMRLQAGNGLKAAQS
ncbi:hypothetical protein OKW26_001696 [Paraburkholderia sp. 32]